jgi:plastocyanin
VHEGRILKFGQRVFRGLCASGVLALGIGLSALPAGAAGKATAQRSTTQTTTPSRAHGISAAYHGARTGSTADFTVGVDSPPPAGHNIEYVDYFPRALTVHTGAVIDFNWPANLGPDSFHTATLLPAGTSADTDSASNPPVAPDEGGESPPLYSPFATFGGTFPPPGSGAPGACGDPTTPCTFDGTSALSSGATGPGSDFFVTITAAPSTPTDYVFHCRVHPGMQATLTVAPSSTPASNPATLAANSATQVIDDTAAIFAAEDAANHGAYVTNPDGTHHVTITAGIGVPYAEALEMLPQNVRVAPGDSVSWNTLTNMEIHTVTFPEGHGSDSVDPFNFAPVCETGPPDAVATNSGCTSGNPFDELPVDPAPQGPTTLASPSTVASSGIIGAGGGLPSSHTFTFSGAGAFHYQCRVHDHMSGTIFASPSPSYWNVAGDGGVFTHGMAAFGGSLGAIKLNAPVVGISTTPDVGYVLAGSDGGVFALGDAAFKGSMGGTKLNKPVVGVSETPSGGGYRLVASDGGVFTFGDAGFAGSMGGTRLNAPMVGIATTPSGRGYWMVASDGGVFTFGDAGYHGSTGGMHLNAPVVGMAPTPSGNGYWLVAADGGVFAFGDAGYHGSTGAMHLNKPVVGMAADLGGLGYWLVASDGGVFSFGDARFLGSEGATPLNSPVVGMAAQ